jgi:hypothetical protein
LRTQRSEVTHDAVILLGGQRLIDGIEAAKREAAQTK